MPIKPELRQFYGKAWKTVTRPRILARAANRCEQCQVPNHTRALRAAGWWAYECCAPFTYGRDPDGETTELLWNPPNGAPAAKHGFPQIICRYVCIVLTVAHLNHVAGDDRDENLKALCQWCHLNYDKQHHHETRATRKDRSRPLLAGVSPASPNPSSTA